MRKDLSQIIGEATERLPKQEQVIDDYWSIMIDDGIGGVVTVTFMTVSYTHLTLPTTSRV